MINFSQFLLQEENIVVYRAINGNFNSKVHDSKNLIWVTTDIEYAKGYGDNMTSYKISPKRVFKFGFRHVNIHTNFEEMMSRVHTRLMQDFQKKKIGKDNALKINKRIQKLKSRYKGKSEFVWYWWNEVPEMVSIIKDMGYDSISATEGITLSGYGDKATTYGVIDKRILKEL